MSLVYECSRNDIGEGVAVLAAAAGVWVCGAGWPDLVVATALLAMFVRSAARVLRAGWREFRVTVGPETARLDAPRVGRDAGS